MFASCELLNTPASFVPWYDRLKSSTKWQKSCIVISSFCFFSSFLEIWRVVLTWHEHWTETSLGLSPRAVASLTVPVGQEFHFPHFFLKFGSIFVTFPQTFLIFFLILALRVGDLPIQEGPWPHHCLVPYLTKPTSPFTTAKKWLHLRGHNWQKNEKVHSLHVSAIKFIGKKQLV